MTKPAVLLRGRSETERPPPPVGGRGSASGWGGSGDRPRGGGVFHVPAAKVGLWVFMGVVIVVFSVLGSAYHLRMALHDWRPLPEPGLLWFNTALLALSSIALHLARVAARRQLRAYTAAGLMLGGLFAWGFLAGQLWSWGQLDAAGFYLASNPANTFFYTITALHGLHLLGGLVAWARAGLKLWRGVDLKRLSLSVELCSTYWHFLLAVWLVLFTLLLRS
ncbi:MAG: cytochrome c oxidase subunit 3 [Gammaproteobacteria bacterium]